MTVPPGLRLQVFQRDDYTCQYCGARPRLLTMHHAGKKHTTLHADHMIPRVRGGHDSLWNLVTACRGCNMAKRDRHWPYPLAYCTSCSKVERGIEIEQFEAMGFPLHTCHPCMVDINSFGTQAWVDIDEIASQVAARHQLREREALGVT